MPKSVLKISLRSLLAFCFAALPATLLFTQSVLAAPTPTAQDSSGAATNPGAAINAGQGDAVTDYNSIFEEELQHQQDLYATITAENDQRNELQAEWSTTNSVPEGVQKRDEDDDEDEIQAELSLAKSVSEKERWK